MMKFIILVFCYTLCCAASKDKPVVQIENGKIQGTIQISAEGRKYYSFQGIRYAEPPVGQNRFQESTPARPWPGIFQGYSPGSECLQYAQLSFPNEEHVHGDEDCLFINVFTPKLPSKGQINELLDVVVYIHMGAFMFGAGHFYGPKYIIDRNVVYVSFNYRLGILGFLSTGDDVVPGNNGLKDQVLALKWVQKNIASFGGNPESVTILGTSAGGASVHYHYLSPLSKGLFKRGISFSGSALAPWAYAENMLEKTKRLAFLVGCTEMLSADLVSCLRSRPARQIVAQTKHFQPWFYAPFSPFGPTAEKVSRKAFITQHPFNILNNGGAQDLPWITSVTSEEGLYPVADYLSSDVYLHDLDTRFSELAPYVLDYNYTVIPHSEIQNVGNTIRQFYFGKKPIGRASVQELIKVAGDRHFVIPAEQSARLQAAVNKSPVYFYYFSYRGAHSWSEVVAHNNINYGSSHGDDVAYIIDAYYSKTDETEADRSMTKLLLDIISSYVHTGTPKVPCQFGIKWNALSAKADNITFLHIMSHTELKIESSKDLGNRNFWNTLPIKEPQIESSRNLDEL